MKRLWFVLALLVIAAGTAGGARADLTCTDTLDTGQAAVFYTIAQIDCSGASSGANHYWYASQSPFELCATLYAPFSHNSAVASACKVEKDPSFDNWEINYSDVVDTGGHNFKPAIPLVSSGCWNSAYGTLASSTLYTVAQVGCTPCTDPKVWDDTSKSCKSPDCQEGWEWDTSVGACRLSCSEANHQFYHYESHSCEAQCPVGGSSVWAAKSNRLLNLPATATVNGCHVSIHSMCQPDSASAGGTGISCFTWFTYNELEPVVIDAQLVMDMQGAGFYQGESAPPTIVGADSDFPSSGGFTQVDSGASAGAAVTVVSATYACRQGHAYTLMELSDGNYEETMNGACVDVDQTPTPNFGNTNIANNDTALQTAVNSAKSTVEATAGKVDGIAADLATVKAQVGNIATQGVKIALNSPAPDEGSFTAPGDTPGYAKQVTTGLSGAVGTGDLSSSQLGQYLNSLVPNLGARGDDCPSFPMTAPFVGSFTFTPYCAAWDVLAALVMAFSAFIAYCIVWRV